MRMTERKTRATGSNVIKYSWTIFRNGRQELRWNSVGIACTIGPGNRAVLFIPQPVNSRPHVLVCLARPTPFISIHPDPPSSPCLLIESSLVLFRRDIARIFRARVRSVFGPTHVYVARIIREK